MPVLDRSELQSSPLADLHTIANELGVDGFRRLRREELVAAILGEEVEPEPVAAVERQPRQRARATRSESAPATSRRRPREDGPSSERTRPSRRAAEPERPASRSTSGAAADGRVVEGVVEVRDNGSAFLRLNPPGPSEDDVYIAPAQVKRCELVSGDRVTGPVRKPRRSERHPSLARIETINGESADSRGPAPAGAAAGASDRPAASTRQRARRSSTSRTAPAAVETGPAFPTQALGLGAADATLAATEALAPLGFGSRAVIVGAARSGKTELLRRIVAALAARAELDVSLVLVGVRPEEIAEWQAGAVAPACALSFAASAEEQGKAVQQALDTAERAAGSGRQAVVLIDTLHGLPPEIARKALASAHTAAASGRPAGSGSLTVIGTAVQQFGGETTVIALDPALAASGRFPALDVTASGTLRPELLVGEAGAAAIRRQHASQASSARRWWPFGRR